ncbi:LOW QUALITY PROTEIN: uncharacterized protein EMH_0026500 [Eimeria mitis]|uniref:Helicase ATP-binding domain-containing protein n=1 Tax=Eimeria mitis TaxID=44415 RepID=U6KC26_9EIME|nr:LOW QUALITY PROTEIN: uncharacterized protein EMH_0026500 [Eimeria mitis]CDJ35494.1 hypothetical protein, conserved [Eimeria mitis]
MLPHTSRQVQDPSSAANAAVAATVAAQSRQQQHQQHQEQQHVRPGHSEPQQSDGQLKSQQQQQHHEGAHCRSGVAADSLLSSFDMFAFNAPKTPQRTTPKKPAPRAKGGSGPHRGSTPVASGSRSSSSSSSRMAGGSCASRSSGLGSSNVDNAATGGSCSSNNNSSSNSRTSAIELQRESELSPGVRLSLEWLEEAERRRGLSSTEVAAAFRCPQCHQFTMTFRSGRYETGMMLASALPRIIQTAAHAYATQQQQKQQRLQQQQQQRQEQQQEGNCSIPDFLRPLSWLPRSDRIKADAALLQQFSDAAIAHAVAVEDSAVCGSEATGGAAAATAAADDGVAAVEDTVGRNAAAIGCSAAPVAAAAAAARGSAQGRAGSRDRLRFVDWSRGFLEAPTDGLKYNDGCVFRLSAYPFILQAAASVCGWAALTPIPSLTLRFFTEVWGPGKFLVTSKERALNVAWWLLPSRLQQHLLPFQWEGVAYALQRGGCAIIGDEMGLGKTVQAIACIAVYRQFPCLIVVPASMRLAWADALEEWLPEYSGPPNLRVLFASGDRPSPGEQHLICLSSFEMASRLYDTLKATQYKLVIVDEAHKLRGPAVPRPAPYTASEALTRPTSSGALPSRDPHLTRPPRQQQQQLQQLQQQQQRQLQRKAQHFQTHESVHFSMPNQSQQQQQQQQQQRQQSELSPRKRKNWRPPGSGQEVNKKVLDLVKGSRHALLLSGTPSVKLPADLFPLVDALLPPLEQEAAVERRQQQLQQWGQLELAAAAAAAATFATATAAAAAAAVPSAEAETPEKDGTEKPAHTEGDGASRGIVRSPWSEATAAWRTASAAAAAAAAAARGRRRQRRGEQLQQQQQQQQQQQRQQT